MTYQVKILGTRYIIEIATENHQWYVRLVVDGSVEEKVLLKGTNERELKSSVNALLSMGGIQVNKLQKDKMISDLLYQAMSLFNPSEEIVQVEKTSSTISPQSTYQQSTPTMESPSVMSTSASKYDTAKKKAFQTGAFELQQRLLHEYKEKLTEVDVQDRNDASTTRAQDLEPATSVNQTLDQLIVSHNKLIEVVKRFDERLSYLERITGKIVEITGDILDEF